MALLKLLASVALSLIAFGLYKVIRLFVNQLNSPLRYVPGPKGSSFVFGNLKDIKRADPAVMYEKWTEEYGPTMKYKYLFNMNRLYTMDTKALSHILMNSDIYQKTKETRYAMSLLLGAGVFTTEGEQHRQQRKIMNPAFGGAQIRELTGIFVEKAVELREQWQREIGKAGAEAGPVRIDALSWLSRMTLDVIGLAGFNYEFNTLGDSEKPNELSQAFSVIFRSSTRPSFFPLLQMFIPILRVIKTESDRHISSARKTMSRIGNDILQKSKEALNLQEKGGKSAENARDLLSLLVRANTAADLPANQQLSDEEVLAQVPTFLIAGHETTSASATWALYALSQDMGRQSKLRQELLTVSTDNPSMDELNSLTYLDYVVRETLRIHAPIPTSIRLATQDDILPLNTPFVDTQGHIQKFVRVQKGDTIIIPILAMNRAKSLWGEDAFEFKPERWECVPKAVSRIPGVWGNMLTFLGGTHACIGYRFSLVEIKAILFTLLRAFEFELAVPAKDIAKISSLVLRPVLLTDPDGGNQMPLLVKPYHGAA